jgi:hypothetical protein
MVQTLVSTTFIARKRLSKGELDGVLVWEPVLECGQIRGYVMMIVGISNL